MQEINQRRIEILRKRVQKFEKIQENRQVIDAQCAAVEDVLQLIRDQSVTMRDPQEVSAQLDHLVDDVEQTEQSVREMEEIFALTAPDCRRPHLPVVDEAGPPAQSRAQLTMNPTSDSARSTLCRIGRGELSEKYYSRTIAMFVLHGNVHDLVAWKRGDRTEYVPLAKFLNEALFGRRDLVLSYDRGGGIGFANAEMQADFQRALTGYDSFHGTKYAQGLPRNPDGVLTILDSYLRLRVADGKKIAVSIGYADTIVPAGDASSMGSEDRNCLVILKRWAQNPIFLRADVTVCLITESLIGTQREPGAKSRASRRSRSRCRTKQSGRISYDRNWRRRRCRPGPMSPRKRWRNSGPG